MEFFPFPATSFLAGAFASLLTLVLFLNIFGLPANWLILGLCALLKLIDPLDAQMGVFYWLVMFGLAILGEVLETALQVVKARKYGSSSSGAFAGMIGAIIGAIALAPLFWGIGAFIGALAGAWFGCFCMELLKGRHSHEALNAAFGTMLGRFLGTVLKIAVGALMIAFTAHSLWPEQMPDLPLPQGGGAMTFLQAPGWPA